MLFFRKGIEVKNELRVFQERLQETTSLGGQKASEKIDSEFGKKSGEIKQRPRWNGDDGVGVEDGQQQQQQHEKVK